MTCTYLAKRLRELSSTKTGSYPHEFLCRTNCFACADYQPCCTHFKLWKSCPSSLGHKVFFFNSVRWVKTGYWSLFGVFDLRKSIQLLNKNLLECWYLQKQVSRSHGRACIKKYGLSLSKSLCEILTFGYFSLKSIKTSVWVLSRTNVMWLEYNFGPNLTRLISFLLAAGRAFSGDIQKS